ncbi:hypothetical protein C0J52_10751 [Blattella germanica]|nr:hypothetical protein C0J52_10751 [Blattella germanica]
MQYTTHKHIGKIINMQPEAKNAMPNAADGETVEKKKISATLCPKRLISKISRDQGSGCVLFIRNVLLTLLIVKGLKIMLKMSSHRRYTSHGSFTMIVIKASKALSFSSAVFASITQFKLVFEASQDLNIT